MISYQDAHKHLRYDPTTGLLWWKISFSGRRLDRPAGTDENGYVSVFIMKYRYKAHRLIWFMQTGSWPKGEIDHRNLIRSDNRWKNLRDVDRSRNQINCARYKSNKSGHRGVAWHKLCKRWHVTIQFQKRPIYLGLYDNFDEACAVYVKAAKKYFGEEVRV